MSHRESTLVVITAVAVLVFLSGCLSDEKVAAPAGDANNPIDNTNSAPSISGNPPGAVLVGEAYSFTPSASDPDGDRLTFSIENLPSWASFDTSTGTLTGTPTLGNVGTFSNIRISVSDGTVSAGLSGFNVDVTQVATASTTLQWTAPTMNEDGTMLTNLAGYKLYYGKSSGNYTNTITIDNTSITIYVVENLTPDTYFFAATAFNSSGVESQFSGEAIRNLN